ncbi:MAG: hypothetical protein JWO19_6046 [Bryobacterales bacterium]|nr:hypothetical protein [Bryobacterales bacterium]
MFEITKLKFDQVQFVERCSLAPLGEIIQMFFNGQNVVGIRTYYNDAMGGAEAIMVIGGTDHGGLISLEHLGNAPAVIVTKLVRLVAARIAPFVPLIKQPEVGNLLQRPDGAMLGRSVVVSPSGVTQPAYVYLTPGKADNGRDIPIGTCVNTLSFVDLRGISQSFELEMRPEPTIVSAN